MKKILKTIILVLVILLIKLIVFVATRYKENQKDVKILENLFDDLDYLFIDVSNKTEEEIKQLLKVLNGNYNEYGTPYVNIVQNGKVLEQFYYIDENELKEKMEEYGIKLKRELLFNYINYDQYKEEIKKEDSLILVSTVSKMETNTRMELENIIKNYNIKINYFNIKFQSNIEQAEFINLNEVFKESLSVPAFIIIKNGKVLDYVKEDVTSSKVIDLLSRNGIIQVGE